VAPGPSIPRQQTHPLAGSRPPGSGTHTIVTIAAPGPECGGEQFGVWSTETLARPHVPFPDLRITHMPSLLSRMRGLALLYAQEHENGEQAEAEHHQHAEDRRVCQ
jgi:hypothetical protein